MNKTFAMKPRRPVGRALSAMGALAFFAALAVTPLTLQAQAPKKNPTGKIYVASLTGSSQLSTGDKIEALTQKSIFFAQGAQIETKPGGTVALVFSNGTGISLAHDTHIEVKLFTQEPFVPNRTDLETEPSISHTQVLLSSGTLAVSTSKLAAGSTLTILTPLGSINLRSGKVVIDSEADFTKISLLDGEGTVLGGGLDLGGKVLHPGEQAIIRPGSPGQPNLVAIGKIPDAELAAIQDEADMAYAARKTVFFETDATGDIQAVPVVPSSVPVQATVSPSQLPH
jgi:hypothetical protein